MVLFWFVEHTVTACLMIHTLNAAQKDLIEFIKEE